MRNKKKNIILIALALLSITFIGAFFSWILALAKIIDSEEYHLQQLGKNNHHPHVKKDLATLFPNSFLERKKREKFKFQAEPNGVGVGKPLKYLTIPKYLESKRSRRYSDITILTFCSLSKLENILDIARGWDGVISLAVYVQNPLTIPQLEDILTGFFVEVEDSNPKVRLDISLLFGQGFTMSPKEENSFDKGDEESWNNRYPEKFNPYDFAFPMNSLRNLALEQASTEFVFSLDSDFLLSANMHQQLTSPKMYNYLTSLSKSSSVGFIIPAFETLDELNITTFLTRSQLDEYCADLLIVPYHSKIVLKKIDPKKVEHWCQGKVETYHLKISEIQGKANYPQWFRAEEPYSINLGPKLDRFFEPYLIIKRSIFPKFDESFRGYSFNKRSHMTELQYAKFKFYVLPNNFVIHRYHPFSFSRGFFKKQGILNSTVQRTYEKFLMDIRKRYSRKNEGSK